MVKFNPQYLKELRIQQQSTLDEELVERVKKEILKANAANSTRMEISFRVDSPWKKLIVYFEELGFWVSSAGYVDNQYDNDGTQVYWFIFNWQAE